MKEQKIIKELLNLIDKYDNNETSKSITLDVEILDSFVLITKLHTKGEVNKWTPFYSGNTKTVIITEEWYDGKVVNAWIVAEN